YLDLILKEGDCLYVPSNHWKRKMNLSVYMNLYLKVFPSNGLSYLNWLKRKISFEKDFAISAYLDKGESFESFEKNLAEELDKILSSQDINNRFIKENYEIFEKKLPEILFPDIWKLS